MAPRQHKHWPEDHPFYERAPFCDLPTKGACDQRWTEFQHGHAGQACVKDYRIAEKTSKRKDGTVITQKGEASRVATCTIVNLPDHGQSMKSLIESARKGMDNAIRQR